VAKRRLDPGVVIACTWLAVAIGVTLIFGPRLGMRGWFWLALHHIFCVVGCSHELWRGWKRRQVAAE
jgi:hypothetical protein